MSDGQVPVTPSTASNLLYIDNSAIGPTTDLFRQRVVLGDDSSSGRLAQVGSTAPAGTEKALYVRPVGSSGTVLGAVAPSTTWDVNIASAVNLNVSLLTSPISVQGNSTALGAMYVSVQGSTALTVAATTSSVVGLTTTSVVGLTTTSVVGLSSALSNYVTNSTTVPVYLGASTSNIIGIVGLSSAVTLSSGALPIGQISSGTQVIGTVIASSGLGASTAIIGSLSSGAAQIGILGPSSGNVIGTVALSSGLPASTAIIGSLSSGTAQIGILGPSSGNVIGTVLQSSNWNISTGAVVGLTTTSQVALTSGTLTLGTLTTGTIVGLTTTSNVGLTTVAANIVSLSTTVLPVLAYSSGGATPAGQVIMLGGVVSATGVQAAQTSGTAQNLLVDQLGRPIITLYQGFRTFNTASALITGNTCQQQLIAAQGANTVAHITALTAFSSAGTTALGGTIVGFYSCSGGAVKWQFPVSFVPTILTQYTMDFDPPLTQQTANNAWLATCSSSGTNVNISAQYFITST